MKLQTLADVRTLVEKHLPAEYRSKFTPLSDWHDEELVLGISRLVQSGMIDEGNDIRMRRVRAQICKSLNRLDFAPEPLPPVNIWNDYPVGIRPIDELSAEATTVRHGLSLFFQF